MFECVLLNFRQEIWPEQFETIPETFSEIQNRKKRTAFYWLIVAILIAMPSVAHIFASPFFMYSNQHKMSNISECTNSNTNNIKSNLSTEIDLNETKAECSSTPSNDFVGNGQNYENQNVENQKELRKPSKPSQRRKDL